MKNIKETKKKILDALENKPNKEYYIDFETWIITAKGGKEAEKEALRKLKEEGYPQICNIEET